MRTRTTVLATAAAALLIGGAALAQAHPDGTPGQGPMDRMHDSQEMREMHGDMPNGAREDCDDLHQQMEQQMDRMFDRHMEETHHRNWDR
ncbi:hypothetical protein [Phytoactinopolyspora mesophila]|uniref:Uncharacterized protein n=1 Tax=Phytoactinopolyspora mesophila TaxID=2650750 RepID=A0A7K3M8R6_9ACTN|nr:hypothetical protein [Phytoactinopolyspora mesophila]NDL59674.1 hypothetical protein [Phytoactinopolyspora mesophila]